MNPDEARQQIDAYNRLLSRYEELGREISVLLKLGGGDTAKLRADKLAAYRQLARERDDIASEMRMLEQLLSMDE
jgi:hypothetical protein